MTNYQISEFKSNLKPIELEPTIYNWKTVIRCGCIAFGLALIIFGSGVFA